tara:strand:- start:669 stop:911 length:243 start_codon:yes stop_codon:yes gene_type:complete
MTSPAVTNNLSASKFVVSKYDQLSDVTNGEINFEIGKTRFKISKEKDEITINYISSAYVDFTYSCSDREDFENFVGTIFN